jgi:hypothetical protein
MSRTGCGSPGLLRSPRETENHYTGSKWFPEGGNQSVPGTDTLSAEWFQVVLVTDFSSGTGSLEPFGDVA